MIIKNIAMIPCQAKKIFGILIPVLFVPFLLFSQSRNERVTIVGSYQPTVKEASKINFNPAEPESKLHSVDFDFTDPGYRLSLAIEPPLLAYLQAKTDEKTVTYRNYLKAALGTNLSPVFMFRHHSALSKKTSFDLGLNHESTWTNIKDFSNSTWMQNNAAATLVTEISDYIWQNSVEYRHNWLHYYGFKSSEYADSLYTKDELTQHYQRIHIATDLKSNYKNSKRLNHQFGIAYNQFADRYQNTENLVRFKAGLNKTYDWFNIDGEQVMLLDANFDFLSATDSLNGIRGLYGEINPKLQLNGSFYALETGLLFGFGNDTAAFFHLHPQLSGKLFVFDSKVEIYAGFEGMRHLNTLESITRNNPFVKPGQDRWWTNTTHDFKAGIKTGAIPNTDLHLGIQYRQIEHGGFFVTDTTSLLKNQMTVLWDDYKLLSFIAQASFHHKNKLVSSLLFQYNQYTMKQLEKPWHMPEIEAGYSLAWQYNDSWNFNAGLIVWAERFAPAIQPSDDFLRLRPAIDLNLKTSYQISRQFGIFAQLSNVFNNRYERYHNYPVQGAQLFAGMSLQF